MTEDDPVLPPDRRWWAYTALSACVAYGLLGTFWYSAELVPGSIRAYPLLGGRFLLLALAVGGATALAGMLGRSPAALRVERAGLLLLVGVTVGYAVWTPFSVGWRATLPVLFLGLLIAVASTGTAVEVTRRIALTDRLTERRRKGR